MKPNELRRGNWVGTVYSAPYIKITEIKNAVVCGLNCKGISYASLKPIPLTEEILLNCGFEKFLKGIKGSDIHDTYRLGFFQIENHFGIYMFHGIEIKHIHQLQNLFFAISGHELNIEL